MQQLTAASSRHICDPTPPAPRQWSTSQGGEAGGETATGEGDGEGASGEGGGGGYGSHVGCAPRQKRLFWMLAGSFAQQRVRAFERHKPMLRACKYGGISKMYAHQAWVQQLTRTSPRHDDAPGPWAASHGE